MVKVANTVVAFQTNGFPLLAYPMNAGSIMQAFSLWEFICLIFSVNNFSLLCEQCIHYSWKPWWNNFMTERPLSLRCFKRNKNGLKVGFSLPHHQSFQSIWTKKRFLWKVKFQKNWSFWNEVNPWKSFSKRSNNRVGNTNPKIKQSLPIHSFRGTL